jgi:4-amino-4-deoxy-L-arabinose transferase-like glycosyltransferase
MQGRTRLWIVSIIFLGAFVRWPGLFANSFHPDEALFSSWARLIAVWRDPLLASQPVDKPPLLFYLQALSYPLMGTAATWVARLPNFIASLLLIPLTARLAWRLYRDWLPVLAATLFVALSPFAVQFGATAFTDPLMTSLISASVLAAVSPSQSARYSRVSGLMFGLALTAKYQALFFLPLLFALGWMHQWSRPMWRRWLCGAIIPVAFVLVWAVVRTGPPLWAVQATNYGGVRLAWSWELWPRLEELAKLGGAMVGSPVLGFALLLAFPVFLALLIYDRDWPTAYDQLLLLFIIAYIEIHWFLNISIWDRYLLPLVPLVALLFGQFGTRVISFVGPTLGAASRVEKLRIVSLLFLVILLIPPALAARHGAFPLGGLRSADEGAAQIAVSLSDAPPGTVLYDHWYSWQWRYHFFDTSVYVSWFADPAALAADLRTFGSQGTRFIVLPANETAAPIHHVVTGVGYRLKRVEAAGNMVLYRLEAGSGLP